MSREGELAQAQAESAAAHKWPGRRRDRLMAEAAARKRRRPECRQDCRQVVGGAVALALAVRRHMSERCRCRPPPGPAQGVRASRPDSCGSRRRRVEGRGAARRVAGAAIPAEFLGGRPLSCVSALERVCADACVRDRASVCARARVHESCVRVRARARIRACACPIPQAEVLSGSVRAPPSVPAVAVTPPRSHEVKRR